VLFQSELASHDHGGNTEMKIHIVFCTILRLLVSGSVLRIWPIRVAIITHSISSDGGGAITNIVLFLTYSIENFITVV
jgi:hypothetical protein